MSSGHIRRRGKSSWRIKYDLPRDPETGDRRIAYATVRGKRTDAEKELRRLLHAIDRGAHIDPSTATVSEYLDQWLNETCPRTVAPKALERYRGLVEQQIKPHLGKVTLQKLRPSNVDKWLKAMGLTDLSVTTIRHAHATLRTALNHAVSIEIVDRNVAAAVKPPVPQRKSINILTAGEIADTLKKLNGHSIYPMAVLAIGTGARRGEIAALRWSDVDLDGARITIQRSLEETKDGMSIKAPKTRAGRRAISLPAFAVAALRNHRRQTLELRLKLGIGQLPEDAPVFATLDGDHLMPHILSNRWRRAVRDRKLPKVTFHALRHSHASALISAGLDVVSVSRRLGHASPALTLNVYAHLFRDSDDRAAEAIEAAFGKAE